MLKTPPGLLPKIQFYVLGPRLTEVPRFRSNRLRAEGCEFNPHRRHFFSCRPVAVNEHFRNMKRTKRQRFYGQRYTPQGYDYK